MDEKIKDLRGREVNCIILKNAIQKQCGPCPERSAEDNKFCNFEDHCPVFTFCIDVDEQNTKAMIKAIYEFCSWCHGYDLSQVIACNKEHCSFFEYRFDCGPSTKSF